jgi:hypothetical protein
VEQLFVFIREMWPCPVLADQRRWGSAPNPGVYRMGAIGSGESVPSPERGFPFWEPIAPAGLLGLLSSRALSIPAVNPRGILDAGIPEQSARPVKKSTFAQINSVHFCSARHSGRSSTEQSMAGVSCVMTSAASSQAVWWKPSPARASASHAQPGCTGASAIQSPPRSAGGSEQGPWMIRFQDSLHFIRHFIGDVPTYGTHVSEPSISR